MWMFTYIIEVKKQLRDVYDFTPSRTSGGEPCFEHIPDGDYPMKIDGKLDHVKVVSNHISCYNFDEPSAKLDEGARPGKVKA